MKQLTARILLILLILAFAAISCIGVGGGGDNGGVNGNSSTSEISSEQMQTTLSVEATATYGAEQFHLQLTAIAGQGQ